MILISTKEDSFILIQNDTQKELIAKCNNYCIINGVGLIIKLFCQHVFKIIVYTTIFLFNQSAQSQEQNTYAQKSSQDHRWIDFYQEKVTMTLYEKEMMVEGNYYMCNLTNGYVSVKIQYPFPVDENHPFPHKIDAGNHVYQKDFSSIYFNLSFNPKEDKLIKIMYSQYHYNKTTKYILSSTQKWGHPIQTAEFIISVPRDWDVHISIDPYKKEMQSDRLIYYILRNQFFPKEDLLINWQ